ncbi:MAG: SHOCT domain-containing protein [Nitrospira sp.]|nr:SHOCT domain-containing protein [Nitrospira sp.]
MRRSLGFGWVWVCLLTAGCTAVTPQPAPLCVACDDQRLVRVTARTPGVTAKPNEGAAKSARLDSHEWEQLLRTVMVRSIHQPLLGVSYRGAIEPVFADEDVRYLGASLQRAFQDATADDQILFALARPLETGVTQVTSGAWFVEAGNFHLRLANCRVAVTLPSIRRQIWKDPLFTQAGALYELVPGDRQALVPTSSDGLSLFRSDQPELVIDYAGRREEAAPAAPAATATPPSAATVEERLAILKRLYEQGLITDEDYRLKKQQLLDRL